MKRAFAFAAVVALALWAQAAVAGNVSLTIYNDNLALVRDVRNFSVNEGLNTLKVTDVAALLDATSVHFKPLGGIGIDLLEQNFDYDLLSQDKLLSKFIGEKITLVDDKGGRREVTLLSTSGGLIVDDSGKILLNPAGKIELPRLAGGLLLKPTLNWLVDASKSGATDCEISYLTTGLAWNADYVFLLNKDDTAGDMEGWVTINNTSGATYEDAALKLIAGTIHRATAPQPLRMYADKAAEGGGGPGGFVEKPFFEYHIYELGRPTTIRDNQTKQISLLTAADIPAKKVYVAEESKVNVKVEFKNAKDQHLGIPLPQGRVRVFKRDDKDIPQFVGEDNIEHTPKDEQVRLTVGEAFDIKVTQTQTNYQDLGRGYRESWKVSIRNHKDQDVVVIVPHHVYGDWRIVDESYKSKKTDAFTFEYAVPVKANAESTLNFTFEVVWY